MKAYIECIHDEVLKLSTGRYAKMHVIVPQREGENYQKYHLGECVMQQDGKAHAMKAYIECTWRPGDGPFSVPVCEAGRDNIPRRSVGTTKSTTLESAGPPPG